MLSVIGQVLTEAAVITLSPFPVAGLIIIFFTEEARTSSRMFMLGWLLGLSAVATAVILLVNAGTFAVGENTVDTGIGWGSLLLGLALLFLAYRYWQKRPEAGEPAKTPTWMAALESITPGGAFRLGLLLSAVNPKSLLLTVAAAATIASADLDLVSTIIATTVFILLSSATIFGLLIYARVSGARAEKTLNQTKAWLIQNNATIMTVVFLMIGAKQLGQGLSVF